jgi:mono/diheme cytochrome c family protein
MPPFRNLREDEIVALIGYLQQIAGVALPRNPNLLVPESAARVGEHVVKGTCHICHALPGLSASHSLSMFKHQVQKGSPPMTKMMTLAKGDAMPAYPYFTEEEIAAAYYYLMDYLPQSWYGTQQP